ncbi:hypothetical protein ACQ4PT_017780 [Festuca glaucescens]
MVARHLAAVGSSAMGSIKLRLHLSETDARAAAALAHEREPIPVPTPGPTSQPSAVIARKSSRNFSLRSWTKPIQTDAPGLLPAPLPCAAPLFPAPNGTAPAPAVSAPLDNRLPEQLLLQCPSPCSSARHAAAPAPSPIVFPPAFNVTPTPRPLSYLQALLTPAAPPRPPKTPSRPPARSIASLCFRCLSPHHPVRECRDPVACLGCGASGHRRHTCTMARPLPTVAQPATVASPQPSPPTSPSRRDTPFPASLAPRRLAPPALSPVCFSLGESSSPATHSPPPRDIPMLVAPALPQLPRSAQASPRSSVDGDHPLPAPQLRLGAPC